MGFLIFGGKVACLLHHLSRSRCSKVYYNSNVTGKFYQKFSQKRKHKNPPQTSQRRRISQREYGMISKKSLEGNLIRKSNRNAGKQVIPQGVRRMAQNDTPVSESKVRPGWLAHGGRGGRWVYANVAVSRKFFHVWFPTLCIFGSPE